MNSRKLVKSYKTLHFWCEGFRSAAYRELSMIQTNDEDREFKNKVENILWNLRMDIQKAYNPRVGKAILDEVN